MFQDYINLLPEPFKGAKWWVSNDGERCWDALCAVASQDRFSISDVAPKYMKVLRKRSIYRCNKEIQYMLELSAASGEPAARKTSDGSWVWLRHEDEAA